MKKHHARVLAVSLLWLTFGSSARADLPSWLRKQNADVDDGNEAIQKGDPKGALESYNRAAHKLPEAPGVALDRGIALLKQGDFGKAREALLSATVPNASTDVRADAYQDLSLSFYREADGLATQNNHAEAQKLFREALDAAKRSLHLRPADANTAWNMELAARRVREEEQKQKDEDEQKQKDQQNKKDEDQQKQDGDKQNQDQKQDGDKGQDQKQDQGKPDKPEPKKPEEQNGQPDKPKQPDKPEPGEQQPAEPKDQAKDKGLPPEAEQALDSLENGEENFERYRARQRASRERRAPEKDW